MKMKNLNLHVIYLWAALLLMASGAVSCIEDGYVTSPDAQPVFSTSDLRMGTFFTEDVTPTYSFVVYNRHDKILSIDRVALRNASTGVFRLNVDGMSGRDFSHVEIRPNDSIFVFVEARMPLNGAAASTDYSDYVDFTTAGTVRSVKLTATGQDVLRHKAGVIDRDTRWTAEYPHRIFDSVVVAPDVTLTLEAGAKLCFHDKARLKVHGTLRSEGTAEAPVVMGGDRTDNVVGQIPFDLMAGQWDGVVFHSDSRRNYLSHTVVKNTVNGVTVEPHDDLSTPALEMVNCRLRNSQTRAFRSEHSNVRAVGCEFAEASYSPLELTGGVVLLDHCTMANYYLFTAIYDATIHFSHFSGESRIAGTDRPLMQARITNCVIYGLGQDLNVTDFTGTEVTLERCLLKSNGSDDANFIRCIWGADPLYYTVRDTYTFDYRLRPGSPAIAAADPALSGSGAATDFYGTPRAASPALGAYEYVAP